MIRRRALVPGNAHTYYHMNRRRPSFFSSAFQGSDFYIKGDPPAVSEAVSGCILAQSVCS